MNSWLALKAPSYLGPRQGSVPPTAPVCWSVLVAVLVMGQELGQAGLLFLYTLGTTVVVQCGWHICMCCWPQSAVNLGDGG